MNIGDASGGNLEPLEHWFESKLTEVSVITATLHAAKFRGGAKYTHLTISFLHKLEIYIKLHTISMHIVC
jgi:hypothetical protein